ncbi:basic proline-rich protein-like [Dama dama]|uniref:basic proline-rich protein-like n=1 Tax=Dama dama TaxID=30532 RepID=UPI002A36048D|nr:basic proline-rich protein-like [Dama dama]
MDGWGGLRRTRSAQSSQDPGEKGGDRWFGPPFGTFPSWSCSPTYAPTPTPAPRRAEPLLYYQEGPRGETACGTDPGGNLKPEVWERNRQPSPGIQPLTTRPDAVQPPRPRGHPRPGPTRLCRHRPMVGPPEVSPPRPPSCNTPALTPPGCPLPSRSSPPPPAVPPSSPQLCPPHPLPPSCTSPRSPAPRPPLAHRPAVSPSARPPSCPPLRSPSAVPRPEPRPPTPTPSPRPKRCLGLRGDVQETPGNHAPPALGRPVGASSLAWAPPSLFQRPVSLHPPPLGGPVMGAAPCPGRLPGALPCCPRGQVHCSHPFTPQRRRLQSHRPPPGRPPRPPPTWNLRTRTACDARPGRRCRRRTKAEPRGPGGSSVGACPAPPGWPRTCAPSCPAAFFAARPTSAEAGAQRARPSPSDRRAPGSGTRSRLHLDRRRRERRPGRTPSCRPGPGSQPAAGAVPAVGPSPGFLGTVGVAPSSPRGPYKMEDVVSSLSHDGNGGRLPTGLRRGEAPPALGARRAPPPAFQTPAPAPFAEAPALPALTGLLDTGQGGLGGHRGRGVPEAAALAAVARAGGPAVVFGPPEPDSAQPQGPSRGRCCGNWSRRPDPDGPGHGGGGEGGGGMEARGCGLRLTDRASDHPLKGGS